MKEENKVPVLYRLLFGETAERARQGASRQLEGWAEGFEAWLDERRERSPSTVIVAQQEWRRFLQQCRKMPWEVGAKDIEGFSAWMLEGGYSPKTIVLGEGLILDFLRWWGEREGEDKTPDVRRTKVGRYERAKLLSREEAERLLEVMSRDETPVGRRDYAFALARLRMGNPLKSIRGLKWGEIAIQEIAIQGIPGEVREAVRAAMRAGGRLSEMRREEYVFVPLGVPGILEAGSRGEHWLRDRQLSRATLLANVKKYGAAAGIPAERLTLQAMRNTAIRLRLEEGASLEEMRVFMESKEDKRQTKYRLRKLMEVPFESEGQMRTEVEASLPNRTAKPFQPGHEVKHGLYAHFQPPEAVAAVLRENIQGIEEQIVGLRTLARGLLERQAQAKDSQEAAQLNDSYSKAASRLAQMIRAERMMRRRVKTDEQAEEILEQIDTAVMRLGGEPISDQIWAQALGGEASLRADDRRLAEEIASLRYVLRNTFRLAMQADERREYMRLAEIYGMGCLRLLSMLREERVDGDLVMGVVEELIDEVIREAGRRLGVSLD